MQKGQAKGSGWSYTVQRGVYRCKSCQIDPGGKPSEVCQSAEHKEFYKKKLKYGGEWRRQHPMPKNEKHRRQRISELKSRYGMSPKDVEEMKLRQQGNCAICQEPLLQTNIDHDHTTGKVRGLLCPACNMGLGHFGDRLDLLQAAIIYLVGVA